jgi:hypothetical protein
LAGCSLGSRFGDAVASRTGGSFRNDEGEFLPRLPNLFFLRQGTIRRMNRVIKRRLTKIVIS